MKRRHNCSVEVFMQPLHDFRTPEKATTGVSRTRPRDSSARKTTAAEGPAQRATVPKESWRPLAFEGECQRGAHQARIGRAKSPRRSTVRSTGWDVTQATAATGCLRPVPFPCRKGSRCEHELLRTFYQNRLKLQEEPKRRRIAPGSLTSEAQAWNLWGPPLLPTSTIVAAQASDLGRGRGPAA